MCWALLRGFLQVEIVRKALRSFLKGRLHFLKGRLHFPVALGRHRVA
jgi:hypothetical protein